MFKQRFLSLLDATGAVVEDDRFITRAGCKIVKETRITDDVICLDDTLKEYISSGEFNARLCYLQFPEEHDSQKSVQYVRKMIHEHQHFSIWNDFYITFLIVGICDETVKELLAHVEATASRLTSSKTKAQTDTYYRIQGTPEQQEIQKDFINEFLVLREKYKEEIANIEFNNLLNLGCKAGALTYTMSLKNLRKMIKGRLPEQGNETEVQEIVRQMLSLLKDKYPEIFHDIS